MNNSKNVKKLTYLIIAAHPDDEVIGCSSILLRKNVGVLHITKDFNTNTKDRNEIYKKLFLDEYKNLSYPIFELPKINVLAEQILDFIEQTKPIKVFVHHKNDLHQDHNIVTKATEIAIRMNRNDFIKGYYQYFTENPFNLKNCKFIKIEKDEKFKFLDKYLEYINPEHFKTIMSFNEFCGAYSNQKFAEPFKVIWERF